MAYYMKTEEKTYNVGDTVSLRQIMNGFNTSNGKTIYVECHLPYVIEAFSASITSLDAVIRGSNGYGDNISSATELTSKYSITAEIISWNIVRIAISSTTAITNLTPQTPVSVSGTITIKFG